MSTVSCEVFLSAFNSSERVQHVFEEVSAGEKHWLVHKEYAFESGLISGGPVYSPNADDEIEFWFEYLADAGLAGALASLDLVVDITGMLRPHLLSLLRVLQSESVVRVRFLYSEPARYVQAEKTTFSKGHVSEVRQVHGFEGAHDLAAVDGDVLVIGTGYDDGLIRHVAERYARARKYQVFGLPGLQPQMYQENQLKVAGAAESLGPSSERYWLFAPAGDPFATAAEVQDAVLREVSGTGLANLYLSPLGTKAQVLGFGLFYVYACAGTAASLVLPISTGYSQESSVGLARLWEYDFALPSL